MAKQKTQTTPDFTATHALPVLPILSLSSFSLPSFYSSHNSSFTLLRTYVRYSSIFFVTAINSNLCKIFYRNIHVTIKNISRVFLITFIMFLNEVKDSFVYSQLNHEAINVSYKKKNRKKKLRREQNFHVLERIISIGVENLSLSDRSGRNVCIWRRKENRGRRKLGLSPLFGTYNGLGYIRTVSVCVAILLVPHLTFEYFMQTIRRCSYFFCRLREKRFRIRGTYREKVPYNSALYIDCRSQSLYVLLSKQTYVRNKFPQFSISP